jgi:hypothetical protein
MELLGGKCSTWFRLGYPISLLMAKTAPPCLSRDPGDHAL